MKKIIAIIFAVILMLACAYAEEADYKYAEVEDGVYITAYTGSEAHVWIPEELDGKPVTGISDGAFRGNTAIVTLHIPDSVEIIGVEAFQDCTALRDVHLGKGIERIKTGAFNGCDALLNIAVLTYDFYEEDTAFDETVKTRAYNGDEIAEYWAEYADEDYSRLYVAAMELMYRGDFEAARDIFLSLYTYELGSDYYFYCSARIYENNGMIDEALAIYSLMPDLYDCSERITYYGGEHETDYFLHSPDYSKYYDEYFGEGGIYENWQEQSASEAETETEKSEEPAATEEIIGGADEPTGIVVIGGALVPGENTVSEAPSEDQASAPGIGGGLLIGGNDDQVQPEATEEPAAEPQVNIVVEPNPNLISFHDFSGEMPYEFSDYSKTDGYYVIYYFMDDVKIVDDYIALFTGEGWQLIESEEGGGWKYVTVFSEETGAYFYVSYTEAEGIIGLMYEASIDYGFDPVNGL